MFKQISILIFFSAIIFSSCKKHEEDLKFTFTLTQQDSKISLHWNPVTLSGYKNVSIYRSTSPIPDPTFDKPIDGNFLIAMINDKTVTSYIDSNVAIGSNGMVYYKLVLNLNNRFVVSNGQEASLNAFSILLSSSQSSSYATARLPEANLLYLVNYNRSNLSVVDYSQKRIIASTSIAGYSNLPIYAVMNAGKPELYITMNNSITCYDGISLAIKYTVYPQSGSLIDFKVKNNYLYILSSANYNYAYISTYDIGAQSFIGQKNFMLLGYNSYSSYSNLLDGISGNKLYLKYKSEMYNSTVGYYYKNFVVAFNLVNNVPLDSSYLNVSNLNKDSMNSNNYYSYSSIHMSRDGKYLTCNAEGDVYSFSNQSIHNIRSLNNASPTAFYSNDGKYLLSKTSTFNNTSPMDIYSLPAFSLVSSLRSLNNTGNSSTSSTIMADDFMDNDSLVSYNIRQNFQTSQVNTVLTVLFKKID